MWSAPSGPGGAGWGGQGGISAAQASRRFLLPSSARILAASRRVTSIMLSLDSRDEECGIRVACVGQLIFDRTGVYDTYCYVALNLLTKMWARPIKKLCTAAVSYNKGHHHSLSRVVFTTPLNPKPSPLLECSSGVSKTWLVRKADKQ